MRVFFITVTALFIVSSVLYQSFGESTYFTSYVANAVFHNNFHEVVPGRFYRSAQMSRSDLAETIKRHRIKSVIDLRIDEDGPDKSGKTEEQASAEQGALYRHVPFSSARADQKESLMRLIRSYDELPTPILVHCSSGTHRAGVASAIWLLEKENRTAEEALQQLSLKFGFVQAERDLKAYLQGKPTLDRLISEYRSVSENAKVSFRDWMQDAALLRRE